MLYLVSVWFHIQWMDYSCIWVLVGLEMLRTSSMLELWCAWSALHLIFAACSGWIVGSVSSLFAKYHHSCSGLQLWVSLRLRNVAQWVSVHGSSDICIRLILAHSASSWSSELSSFAHWMLCSVALSLALVILSCAALSILWCSCLHCACARSCWHFCSSYSSCVTQVGLGWVLRLGGKGWASLGSCLGVWSRSCSLVVIVKVVLDVSGSGLWGGLKLIRASWWASVGNVTGYPGVFPGNLHPYPSKPVPASTGAGFDKYRCGFCKNPRVYNPSTGAPSNADRENIS